jgi:hypothetical protein
VNCQENLMDRKRSPLGDPKGLPSLARTRHLASSRSVFRYLRMTSSATFIVSSKSGS